MNKTRWRKVLRDLWGNKTRTLLVVLSIAIGVFAVGMIRGTQIMLREDMQAGYTETNPASAILFTELINPDIVQALKRIDGVEDVEGRRDFDMRIKTGPDTWRTIKFNIIDDYNNIRLDKFWPQEGAWPPTKKGMLLERGSLELANAAIGDSVTIEMSNGKTRSLTVDGTAHNMNAEPVQFTGEPVAFITKEAAQWLGISNAIDQIYISVSENKLDEEHIREVANRVEAKLKKGGHQVHFTYVPDPGKHPADSTLQTLLIILGALGGLSLGASGFLVVNIINGLIAQQTTQIGIMKAIGARSGQIIQMYIVAVIIFGLLSLLIAVPLGGIAAYQLTSFLAKLVNFDLTGFRIPTSVLVTEIFVAVLVPIIAALIPVIRGSRITVQDALSEYGLGSGKFGSHFIDRFVDWLTSRVLRLSRPISISIRNTIRRKGRLILTLLTLTLGGAIYISVLSIQASLFGTLDQALDYFNYDVDINFARQYRIQTIEYESDRIPGVEVAGSWGGASARRIRDDDIEGDNFFLLGTTPETAFINPVLNKGRWLQEGDENAIVLNTFVIKEEPDVTVGDTIKLTVNNRESDFLVVGIVEGVMTGPIGYVNRDYLGIIKRAVGQAGGVQLIGDNLSAAEQEVLAQRAKAHFDSIGLRVVSTETAASIRENIEFQFSILIRLLQTMAVLVAAVGSLGLMGTMSINVLERTREIGVMRAVGASDSAILRIILVEGVLVGLISWVLAAALAYPIGRSLSNLIGKELLESPLNYIFASSGALGWLLAILIIAALASFLPAWKASRLSVRETLAYE